MPPPATLTPQAPRRKFRRAPAAWRSTRPTATPEQFIAKWTGSTLSERSGSQQHFLDLCGVLGVDTPADADPHGNWYAFDKGATKTDGSDGWADVWKRGHFGACPSE